MTNCPDSTYLDVVSYGCQLITWQLFVCYQLGQLLIGEAFVIKQSSSNQELAKLITNKQWPSDQLTAFTTSILTYL